jgi:flagella basal body P-ring formation protein FlgA
VLLQRTRGQAFVECLERQGIFKDLQVPPHGVTVHEAKARFIGGYMQALVDRLNMNQHPQFLSSELEIIEGETVSAQDCKVIKCLADHLYPVVARIIPRIQFRLRLNAEDQ